MHTPNVFSTSCFYIDIVLILKYKKLIKNDVVI